MTSQVTSERPCSELQFSEMSGKAGAPPES
jgi:hypothetical protein